jgi:UDP-N-acetylglucosamine:LPS N-acetylglucosamine transferase
MDRSTVIFGNEISRKTQEKATRSKAKFIKKFGDDQKQNYHYKLDEITTLNHLNVANLKISQKPLKIPEKAVVIGNIRMGFGHYRIAIAIASCANALGYKPLWHDLSQYSESTGSKLVKHQNDLYSFGSRLSQKSRLFNRFFWEPLNSEGFKKLDYNAIDQKNSEIYTPLYQDFPKDLPYIGTHVWPTQGAIHAGMTKVVNVIPDNWPMALHLAEGSIHTVQTPFAYLGYKMLNGFAKTKLKEMPANSIKETGYYIDHELVENLVNDTSARLKRLDSKKPLRILLPVGGAGAGGEIFKEVIKFLLPYIEDKKVQLFLNFGDHLNVYEYLIKSIPSLEAKTIKLFDDYSNYQSLVDNLGNATNGIYAIYHKDIYQAVYSTNLMMRHMDLLMTKPSELAYYPIPKMFIKRVGGHEKYGAIHSSEIGDGTFECDNIKSIVEMIDSILNQPDILESMNNNILKLHKNNRYNGGYEVVKLATSK